MDTDYTVKVELYNKNADERYTKVYPFGAYVNNIAYDLKQLLRDVENLCYQVEGYKERQDWSEESQETFGKMRKRLLNNINNIQRLPDTLCCKGVPINSMSSGEMMAKILNKA